MFWPLFLGRLFSLPFLQMLDSSIQDQDSWSLGMGGETSRPVNLRIHMFGNWCRFFCYMWRAFFIYFSLCIFFKHLFLMFGEFIHPHLPGTLTSTTTMGVWFFYYYYFYLVICLNSGFLGKYYFYFLFWLKFFLFISFYSLPLSELTSLCCSSLVAHMLQNIGLRVRF